MVTTTYRPAYGCLYRKPGSVYSVGYTSEELKKQGLKLKDFLIDPPWLMDPNSIGLSPIGVHILQRPDGSGVWDIYDWIGADNYPHVPDFVMEAEALLGTSRAISKDTPNLSMLEPGKSRHFFGFPFAWPDDFQKLWDDHLALIECPSKNQSHNGVDREFCIALLWEAIDRVTGRALKNGYPKGIDRVHKISMPRHPNIEPSFDYEAAFIPQDMKPDSQFGFAFWQPIPRFEIVYDSIGKLHEAALKALEGAGVQIPFMLVSE